MVGNLISDGFGGEDNTVVLFDAAGAHPLATASKTEVARSIVAAIAAHLPN